MILLLVNIHIVTAVFGRRERRGRQEGPRGGRCKGARLGYGGLTEWGCEEVAHVVPAAFHQPACSLVPSSLLLSMPLVVASIRFSFITFKSALKDPNHPIVRLL